MSGRSFVSIPPTYLTVKTAMQFELDPFAGKLEHQLGSPMRTNVSVISSISRNHGIVSGHDIVTYCNDT